MIAALILALAVYLPPVPRNPPEPRIILATSITTTGAGKKASGGGGGACNGTLDLSTGCAIAVVVIF